MWCYSINDCLILLNLWETCRVIVGLSLLVVSACDTATELHSMLIREYLGSSAPGRGRRMPPRCFPPASFRSLSLDRHQLSPSPPKHRRTRRLAIIPVSCPRTLASTPPIYRFVYFFPAQTSERQIARTWASFRVQSERPPPSGARRRRPVTVSSRSDKTLTP